MLGGYVGAPADTVVVLAATGAVAVYFLSCARYPYAQCPLPLVPIPDPQGRRARALPEAPRALHPLRVE